MYLMAAEASVFATGDDVYVCELYAVGVFGLMIADGLLLAGRHQNPCNIAE
jgi:hypothetical protein